MKTMHSSVAYTRDGDSYDFFHNGDFSGDVIISGVRAQDDEVSIPFSVLKEIVGQGLMQEHICRIEDQTGQDYLDARPHS
jgi:hypothetical protein